MNWQCPTCGSDSHPPCFRDLRERYSSLSDKEKAVARELLVARRLHGLPERGPWINAFWALMRTLFDEILIEVEESGGSPCDILELIDD